MSARDMLPTMSTAGSASRPAAAVSRPAGNCWAFCDNRPGRTVTVEQADTSFRVYDAGQLLIEVTHTTTKTIAWFKARKPEPPRQTTATLGPTNPIFLAGAVTDHPTRIRNASTGVRHLPAFS
jgi:hypothetical protein